MESNNQFICTTCNSRFSRKDSLNLHEKSVHQKNKFGCQLCGKHYGRKDALSGHINSIHKGLKFKCDQCEKEFVQKSYLTTHITSVHRKVKFKCEQCNKGFSSKTQKVSHVRSIHQGEIKKKFPCSICSYEATRAYSLKRHKIQFMKVLSTRVIFVDSKQNKKARLTYTLKRNTLE